MAERFDGARETGLDRGLIADIAFQRQDAAPGLGDFLTRGLVLGGVGAPDRDIGAGGGDGFRHAQSDAGVAAGDEGDFAGQVEGVGGLGRRHGSLHE